MLTSRMTGRGVHAPGGMMLAAVAALAWAVAVATAGPAAGSVSGSGGARTDQGQAAAARVGAPITSAAERAGYRQSMPGFPYRSIPPADAVLAGISCVSASFCVTVGRYADALGRSHSLAEEWNGSRWRILPGVHGTGLSDVSCTSTRFCMALGSHAQRWDGRTWTAAPTPRGLSLAGISCRRPSFCMAVGSGMSRGFACESAAAWNGTRWRAFPALNPCSVESIGFTRVSCVSASLCLAVGASLDPDSKADVILAEEWNGKTWQVLATPPPGIESVLFGVSCPTATFCMAVGFLDAEVNPPCHVIDTNCNLALTWNGSTWQQLDTPGTGGLSAVSCVSATSCIAVSGSQAMAWDGTTWTQLTLAQPGTAATTLPGIACRSATACMAAGAYGTLDGASLPLAEQWNGSTWQIRRTPGPGDAFNGLSGVSCASATRCMAVGNRINGSDVQVTLAERWDGRRWQVLATPSPGPHLNVLNSVSCPAAADCMAVGYYDAAGGHQALAEQWTSGSWTTLVIPHNGTLNAVSCPAVNSCMAVGTYLSAGRPQALTVTWNGATWTVQSSPVLGGSLTEFIGVSCTSGSNCMAAGEHDTRQGTPVVALTARWNGSAWTVLTTPTPDRAGRLTSVSCPRPASCMAVGSYFPGPRHNAPPRTLAESWNGSRWHVRATPAISGQLRRLLTSVSCPMPTRCIAVGGYFSPSGKAFVLAEQWNGTAWLRLVSIASPDPAFNYLYAVSCPAAARCVAVGERGVQLTSAYRWDGVRWQLLQSRNP